MPVPVPTQKHLKILQLLTVTFKNGCWRRDVHVALTEVAKYLSNQNNWSISNKAK